MDTSPPTNISGKNLIFSFLNDIICLSNAKRGKDMSVMRSKDGDNLMVDCSCGCDEGLRIRINKHDNDNYFVMTYTSGNFYNMQNENIFHVIGKKLKKIWHIIRGKDYCYSEICMNREDLEQLKQYLSEIE
jgi:hypothetical protein